MKNLTCICCGAPINRFNRKCEYCGTEYEIEDEIPKIRFETFQKGNTLLLEKKLIGMIADHPTPKISSGSGICYTLNSRDYKGVVIVVLSKSDGQPDGKQPSR